MTGPFIIDGAVAGPPPPVWTCPACRRVIYEGEGSRQATARMCGGDPVTGRGHPLTAMDRDPATDAVVTVGPGDTVTISRTITLDDPDPVEVAVWTSRVGVVERSGGGYPRREITWNRAGGDYGDDR